MFNNVVLDIFIGLVLIYLLYSLLLSIVSEMIVTWMALRSRILRVAIEKMLNDGYHLKQDPNDNLLERNWDFIQRFFLKEFPEFKYSFAGIFYDYPSIKYLSDNAGEQKGFFTQTKPSYISSEMFAHTLIQLLKNKGSGATDMDKVIFCLRFNTYQIEKSTLQNMLDLSNNSGGDISILSLKFQGWYNETMDRTTGWYKRKVQFILFWLGFIAASIFNVDTILIAKILSKDKEARGELVTMGIALSKDSARYKNVLEGSGESPRTQAILDSGYARVTKDINDANMILGLGWGTENLTNYLDETFCKLCNKENYDAVWKHLITYKDNRDSLSSIKHQIPLNKQIIKTTLREIELLATDTLIKTYQLKASEGNANLTDGFTKQLDSLKKLYADKMASVQREKFSLLRDSLLLARKLEEINEVVSLINQISGNEFLEIDSITYAKGTNGLTDSTTLKVSGRKAYNGFHVAGYVIKQVVLSPLKLFGLVVTALMLSLGAPFWFDLLKKLIAIRGSGVKPEEKGGINIAVEPDPLTLNSPIEQVYNTSDPVSIALSKHRSSLELIPGVIAVEQDYYKNANGKKVPCIVVVINEEICPIEMIPKQYHLKVNGQDNDVIVVIENGKVAELHFTNTIDFNLMVKNKSNTDPHAGWGSVAGKVFNTRTNRQAILSCSHVLGGNNDNNQLNGEKNIICRNSSSPIARLTFNLRNHLFDIAYADINQEFLDRYNPIATFADVQKSDGEFETEICMHGFVSGKVAGKIVNHDTVYPFLVKGEIVKMVKLIKMISSDAGKNKGVSTFGDSGSLITKTDKGIDIPIGIAIGGTADFSFAISFKEIFGGLFITPIKST